MNDGEFRDEQWQERSRAKSKRFAEQVGEFLVRNVLTLEFQWGIIAEKSRRQVGRHGSGAQENSLFLSYKHWILEVTGVRSRDCMRREKGRGRKRPELVL